jgi:hypothetical protein
VRPDPDHDERSDPLWGERLVGLGLIALGMIGFGLLYLFWRIGPLMPAAPPGMPSGLMPMLSPIACMVPVIGLGSCGLVLLGLKRLIFPE